MGLKTCVGLVRVRGTALMCHGLDSATRRVSFYSSLDGGGLRPSGPSSGSTGSVRMYTVSARERSTRNIYSCIYI